MIGVSSTTPTIVFNSSQIVRTADASAQSPGVRSLVTNKIRPNGSKSEKTVIMNDVSDSFNANFSVAKSLKGCARISRAAARAVTDMLGLGDIPSAFQGRIAGGKGMWMVDATDEKQKDAEGEVNFWIELTSSQLKFEPHPIDTYAPEAGRLTFEVNTYSRKLTSTFLNFQWMTILVDRGVPYKVFATLLEEDLAAKVGEIEAAMDHPSSVRKWLQDTSSSFEGRAVGTVGPGGIPDSNSSRIKECIDVSQGSDYLASRYAKVTQSGFNPKNCNYLKDLLYTEAYEYCYRIENSLKIGLGRSTSVLMIADPLAVLDEGEVHLGFSSLFRDPKSGWTDNMLHDLDVLVARSPALLPSDVQKVVLVPVMIDDTGAYG